FLNAPAVASTTLPAVLNVNSPSLSAKITLSPSFIPSSRLISEGTVICPLRVTTLEPFLPCFTRCTVIYRHYIRLCRSTRQHRGFHLPRSQLEPAATRLEPPAGLESRGPAAAAPGSGCRRGSWLGREELELLDGPFAALPYPGHRSRGLRSKCGCGDGTS